MLMHRAHKIFFCDHACSLLKMQRLIWICVQVRTDWVYSLFHSALIFEADDGNPSNLKQLYRTECRERKFHTSRFNSHEKCKIFMTDFILYCQQLLWDRKPWARMGILSSRHALVDEELKMICTSTWDDRFYFVLDTVAYFSYYGRSFEGGIMITICHCNVCDRHSLKICLPLCNNPSNYWKKIQNHHYMSNIDTAIRHFFLNLKQNLLPFTIECNYVKMEKKKMLCINITITTNVGVKRKRKASICFVNKGILGQVLLEF